MIVKLNQVVDKISGNEDRFSTNLEYYLAGEHYESERIAIYKKGILRDDINLLGFKFHFPFVTGDTIFMSRNPHLKKAGMVTFDGICSDTSYVLRTKDESVLISKFLPLILQNDHFWAWFEKNKSGSVNYLLNWKTLQEYEFNLPPIDVQKRISTLVWQMEATRIAYEKLISATDDLVKSQFAESFGDPRENCFGYPCKPLSEISDILSGITKGRKPKYNELTKVPYICTANVQNGFIDWTETKYIDATQDEISKYALLEDDILMIEGGDPDKVGRGCLAGVLPEQCIYQNHVFRVRVDKALIRPEFLAAYILLPSTKAYFLWCAKRTTGIATINRRQLSALQVMFPPLTEQDKYIRLVRQCAKSKFPVVNRNLPRKYKLCLKKAKRFL